jgi:hypothetical protein
MPSFSAETTSKLASSLGIPADTRLLDSLDAALEPSLVEWSVNDPRDGRGHLRLTLWTDQEASARRGVALLPADCRELDARLPRAGETGAGLAYSASGATVRFYRLCPVGSGEPLLAAAIAAVPELAPDGERLAAICGAWNAAAIGTESTFERRIRSTLYLRVPHADALGRAIAIAGFEDEARLARLQGVLTAGGRAWPKVWIGRSVGAGGGWKIYYFARRDLDRPTDEALLEVAEASPAVWAAHRALVDTPVDPRSIPKKKRPVLAGVVQLLGLTRGDGPENAAAPPRWTIYLAHG